MNTPFENLPTEQLEQAHKELVGLHPGDPVGLSHVGVLLRELVNLELRLRRPRAGADPEEPKARPLQEPLVEPKELDDEPLDDDATENEDPKKAAPGRGKGKW